MSQDRTTSSITPKQTKTRPLIPITKFPPHIHKFFQPNTDLNIVRMLLSGIVPMDDMIRICSFYTQQCASIRLSLCILLRSCVIPTS